MKDLLDIRKEIDVIDRQIVSLYEDRMKLASEVAEYKIATGKPVFDKEREADKLRVLSSLATSDFTAIGVHELFEQVMAMSRKKQYQMLGEHHMNDNHGFSAIKMLDAKHAKIVYQGVDGAYTQLALKQYFGNDADCFHVQTWRDAMEALKSGQADYAVLPFENSTAGIVGENYDLLWEYGYYIIGEQKIAINHCILGVEGSTIEDIKTVYSHPQALAQCSKYLDSQRNWERIPFKNTAFAAKKIYEDGDKTQAAIASSLTSELYGLKILAEGVQNNSTNETRFIIVSTRREYIEDAKKISICLQLQHKSGALYHVLSHFIYNNLNMTSIESRPIQGRNWEYQFFIDFDGNLQDSAVQNALCGLKDEALDLRIFGNY